MAKRQQQELVAVRWINPNSTYHRQVHQVSKSLVDFEDGGTKVVVWWPSRKKGKKWEGELVLSDPAGKLRREDILHNALCTCYCGSSPSPFLQAHALYL